jgi:peptide/nickel transport system substrate-binding protein
MIERRKNMGSVDQGGWSLFHTWWSGATIDNPVTNVLTRGLGLAGYAGAYGRDRTEALVGKRLNSSTAEEEKGASQAVLRDAMEQVPAIPPGMTFVFTAFRDNLFGELPGVAPFPWNVHRT